MYAGKWKGMSVAIKEVCSNGSLPDMLREANIMASLNHPGILQVHGVSLLGDQILQIVMPLIRNGSLRKYIDINDTIDRTTRFKFCLEAANAVQYLHTRSPPILHRDIKSHNFLVQGGSLLLADFGLSKDADHVGVSTGTWAYSAPEVATFPPKWTEKSDIYSLGMLFYEICSRQLPFAEASCAEEVAAKIRAGHRPTIPADCDLVRAALLILRLTLFRNCKQSSNNVGAQIQCTDLPLPSWLFVLDV